MCDLWVGLWEAARGKQVQVDWVPAHTDIAAVRAAGGSALDHFGNDAADTAAKARAKSKAKRQPAYSPAGFLVDDAGDDGALDECRVFPTFRARGLA